MTWSCRKNGSHYVNACGDRRCAECNNAQTDIEMSLNEDVEFDDDRNIFENLFGQAKVQFQQMPS